MFAPDHSSVRLTLDWRSLHSTDVTIRPTTNINNQIKSPTESRVSDAKVMANTHMALYRAFPLAPVAQQPFSGPGLPHYQGFRITLRHATLYNNPLDE
jgi:hypothetical protein